MHGKLIYESGKTSLYVNINENGEQHVIKTLKIPFPTRYELQSFYNEHDISSSLPEKGVRRSLEKGKKNGQHRLILQYIEGVSLAQTLKDKRKLDIREFLNVSSLLSFRLGQLHDKHIIHRNIAPGNIMITQPECDVVLIDMSAAVLQEQMLIFPFHPDKMLDSIAYLSPELTGRTQRPADHRCDLYSLGICMYEMLTGFNPFRGEDSVTLIYRHLAHIPEPPSSLSPEIPKVISNIIMKLLQKNPEDRYQTAMGVKNDLDQCINMIKNNGNIHDFSIAEKDFCGSVLLPQKLYGRETEILQLLAAFQRCSAGSKELIVIRGKPGTGKSSLARTLQIPVAEAHGFYVTGNQDRFHDSVPYFGITQAVNEWIQALLAMKEDELQNYSVRLKNGLGKEGTLLTRILPSLEWLTGPANESLDPGENDTMTSLHEQFYLFFQSACVQGHPVVFFIDDAQWADQDSIVLLRSIFMNPKISYFLCILAFLEDQGEENEYLNNAINDIHLSGVPVEQIHIGNLNLLSIKQFLNDTLKSTSKRIDSLAELIHRKTQGNAYFLTRFLETIVHKKHITFNHSENLWTWNEKAIQLLPASENTLELFIDQWNELSMQAQKLLQFGACIGIVFDVEWIENLVDFSYNNIEESLRESILSGLIIEVDDVRNTFSHPQIHHFIYECMSVIDREYIHYNIGKKLWNQLRDDPDNDRIFETVDQMNRGFGLVKNNEKESLAELNEKAGKLAMNRSAFHSAARYFQEGIRFLHEDHWFVHYDLSLSLYSGACEAFMETENMELLEFYGDSINKNARNPVDKFSYIRTRVSVLKKQNKLATAIQVGLDYISLVGERIPENPTDIQVINQLTGLLIRLKGNRIERFLNLPKMVALDKIAVMEMMSGILSSAHKINPRLTALMVIKMVSMSLKYGNHGASSMAYGTFGALLCSLMGRMNRGCEFGHLSLELMAKTGAWKWNAQIIAATYSLIFHWKDHIDSVLQPLQDSYISSFETEINNYVSMNAFTYCAYAFLSGKELPRLQKEAESYSDSLMDQNQDIHRNYINIYRQGILNLKGKARNPLTLKGMACNEDILLPMFEKDNDGLGIFLIHFVKCQLGYIFRNFDHAFEHASHARPGVHLVRGRFEEPNFYFYEGLTLLEWMAQEKSSERKWLRVINQGKKKLKKWAKDAPENFLHKFQLLEAEWLKANGRNDNALLMYKNAISGAMKCGFLHEEAISRELAGRFYIKMEMTEMAEYFLRTAFDCYRRWGAISKLSQLKTEFAASSISLEGVESNGDHTKSSSHYLRPESIDFSAFVKSAMSISAEVVLPKLLQTLLQNIMENAGAQRGILLLYNQENLWIKAYIDLIQKNEDFLTRISPYRTGYLSESILSYAIRTKNQIVLSDAVTHSQFGSDPYITTHRVHSVMCIPIMHQGKTTGFIYLENRLLKGAFTKGHLELIHMLSTQVAISIENAFLVERLEQRVAERTSELKKEKKKSDELLHNILPIQTAKELKKHGIAIPKYYESVTVLFTDFQEFTRISSQLTPHELVEELNENFKVFDGIVEKFGIEKIKTIGDAYMAVGGLPIPSDNHAELAVRAALEIRDFVQNRIASEQGIQFQLRVGIHTGPVVAGIVGTKKFQYDIWGDTVNIAARMESHSSAGRITISSETYEKVKHIFQCEERGNVNVKGKGEMKIFYVNGLKE
ncbi:MAG TPA: adenylate/guanylate cyclase domain-containing protein [Saprospiraceae bacterium]|nr:adenylate/guanylate cyclase domain-containing protein [Saprospiraceae bacterium]